VLLPSADCPGASPTPGQFDATMVIRCALSSGAGVSLRWCADAAEWLSQKVDRCSLCFLLVAYTAILIAVLVA
jgi:hypothetical protein